MTPGGWWVLIIIMIVVTALIFWMGWALCKSADEWDKRRGAK